MSPFAGLSQVSRSRDFRRLFATRLISQFSDGVFQVGLAAYVVFSPEKQPSAPKVAAAFAVLLLPYCVVGPFAGVLLDRWRRRQVLVWANALRCAIIVGIAALVAGDADGWLFYAGALAVLSVNRFFLAGLSAALPHVVSAEDLVIANAVSPTAGTIAATVGGGVAFLVNQFIASHLASAGSLSAVAVMLTAAALCAVAALSARTLAKDSLGPTRAASGEEIARALRGAASGLRDGARHVWVRRAAGRALVAISIQRFCYGVVTIMTLLLFRNYFNDPANVDAGVAGFGRTVAASGAGYLLAAAITPSVTRRIGTSSWIVVCAAGAAAVEVGFGTPFSEPMLLVAAFFLGVSAQGAKISTDTIVQREVDDAYRGRVFSFYDVLFNASFVLAAVFAALTLPANGRSLPVLWLVGVGYAATAVAYGRASRRAAVVPSV